MAHHMGPWDQAYTPYDRARNWARARWQSLGNYVNGYEWSWTAFLEWFAALLVLIAVGAVVWLYFLDWNTMRGPVGRYVSGRIGREVRIDGDLKVHLFSWTPSLVAERVTIANPPWIQDRYAADIGKFQVSVRLMPLFSGKTILPNLEFDRPQIQVVRDAGGRTNWDLAGNGDEPMKLPVIHRFVVRDGHLSVDDRVRRVVFEGQVSSNEQKGAGDRAFQLLGEGTLNRNRFTAEVHGGALLNVDSARPYTFAADIHAGTTRVVANGAIVHPFRLGQLHGHVAFSGASMSDLYYLTGLVFPQTPPYRLNANVRRDGEVYTFANMTGQVGQSDLAGGMTVYADRKPVLLHAKLHSRKLRLVDLGPFIGAPPSQASAVKGLPAPQNRAVMARAGRTLILPDTPLDVSRVRQMDADVQYDAAAIVSQDLPLRDFHTHMTLNDAVMKFDPLTFDFVKGKLSGWVAIDARKDVPVTDLDARLTGIQLEQFVKETPPPVAGILEARAKLHAPGNSIHKAASAASGAVTFVVPSGSVRKSLAELTGIDVLNGVGLLLTGDKSSTDLRCGVLRFGARNGNLEAEQFVLDTESVKITGKGSVNLKDETLALQVKGEPKEFRIGRIHAPITVSGPMESPNIGIKATDALGQGGIAAALGLINPFAAILAFVDPGLADDANCAALTKGAAKGGAPVKPATRVRH